MERWPPEECVTKLLEKVDIFEIDLFKKIAAALEEEEEITV